MTERYLRCSQVKDMTGLGRSTIYAKMAKSEFPLPKKLGERSVAWAESAIIGWLDERQYAEYRST